LNEKNSRVLSGDIQNLQVSVIESSTFAVKRYVYLAGVNLFLISINLKEVPNTTVEIIKITRGKISFYKLNGESKLRNFWKIVITQVTYFPFSNRHRYHRELCKKKMTLTKRY
jgi:hypothetical protein